MAVYNAGNDDNIIGGGMGYGYGGGGVVAIVLILLILFAIFGKGFGAGAYDGHGHGYNCGCDVKARPMFFDESNFEEERNINNKICHAEDINRNEGEKTRALIVHESERAADRAWMKDQLCLQEKNAEIAMLKGQIYTDNKFGKVYADLGKIECEMLKKPPLWGCADTPVMKHVDNGCNPCGGRRGRLDDEFFV
ncbi:MAG: hypothetical protein FWG90_05095 [Oscillospiraceae bacterium]|nr:hypothetical protein [Oscillospiraceae bacterium]